MQTLKTETKRPKLYMQRVLPNIDKIRDALLKGTTDLSICKQLAISPGAYGIYKKTCKELIDVYNLVDVELVKNVENMLYKKAMGFYQPVQKVTKSGVVTIDEYFPPDTTAAIFFTTNRDPDRWKHREALSQVNNIQNNQYNIVDTQKRVDTLLQTVQKLQISDTCDVNIEETAQTD